MQQHGSSSGSGTHVSASALTSLLYNSQHVNIQSVCTAHNRCGTCSCKQSRLSHAPRLAEQHRCWVLPPLSPNGRCGVVLLTTSQSTQHSNTQTYNEELLQLLAPGLNRRAHLLIRDKCNGDGWHHLEVVGPQTLEQRLEALLTHCRETKAAERTMSSISSNWV